MEEKPFITLTSCQQLDFQWSEIVDYSEEKTNNAESKVSPKF